MPGIVGIISKYSRKENQEKLNRMIRCMLHESFYTSGIYINDQIGLYAGWVCHKGSFSDCLPIYNEKKDLVLLFSGENFPDKQMIEQLKRQGHEFDPLNASYLIHLYEELGDDFFKHLNGWFSGVLIDLRKSKVILFNDRYRMGRIYYHESKDAFIFSSEAKSLLRVKAELRDIDSKSLGQLFSCNCVLEDKTLFSQIYLIPKGSVWTFKNGEKVQKDTYFEVDEWENQPVLEKEAFYKKLRDTFINILPRYYDSNDDVALSLTGGLDTRMIMANLDYQLGGLPCYTFGGMYRESYDVSVARKVAVACNKAHKVLQVGNEYLSDFSSYMERAIYITDGCDDVSGSSEIYLHELARAIAPIRLTGNYGSEVLRRQNTFKVVSYSEEVLHEDFKKSVLEAESTFKDIRGGHKLSFAVFKEIPWNLYGRVASAQSQVTLRTPYMDNDFLCVVYQAPSTATINNEMSLRLINDGNSALGQIRTDRGFSGKTKSLFSKLPEFYYWSLFKAEYYYGYGMPHWMAKLDSILGPLQLDKLIMGRHKFLHYRIWFKNELSSYVQEILLDQKTKNRPYLNSIFLEKMVRDHIRGNRNYTNEINKVLTTELIQRLLIEEI